MGRNDEVTVALNELDSQTTNVATVVTELGVRVQALIDEINRTAAEGLTGPQTEAVLTRLAGIKTGGDAIAATLTEMGRTPQFPTPPVLPGASPAIPGPFRA